MTALTVLWASTASSTLSTTNQLYTIAGAANAAYPFTETQYSSIGATGFFEVPSQGTVGAEAGFGSIPSPSGKGFLLDDTSLEGQTLQAGNYTPVVRLTSLSAATVPGGTSTSDIIVRLYKRSAAGAYTPIVSCTLAAQSLTSTATTYTFGSTSAASMDFAVGDKLYVDIWLNHSANTAWGVRLSRLSNDTITFNGDPNAEVTTPGYAPTVITGGTGIAVLERPRVLGGTLATRYIPRSFGSVIVEPSTPQTTPPRRFFDQTRAFGGTLVQRFVPRSLGGTILNPKNVVGSVFNIGTRLLLQAGGTLKQVDLSLRLLLLAIGIKDLASRVRLLAVAAKDIASRIRLQSTAQLDLKTRIRVLAVVQKDVATRTRLLQVTLKDLASRTRVLAVGVKDLASRLRLAIPPQLSLATRTKLLAISLKDLASRVRVQVTISRDVASRALVAAVSQKDLKSRTRLLAVVLKSLGARLRLAIPPKLDLASRVRLLAVTLKDTATRTRLLAIAQKDLATRAKLLAVKVSDVASRLRLQTVGLVTKDIASRLRLLAISTKDLASRTRLLAAAVKDAPLRIRLAIPPKLDVSARARVLAVVLKDLASRTRVLAVRQRDVSSRTKLLQVTAKDLASRLLLQTVGLVTKDVKTRLLLLAVRVRDQSTRIRLAAFQVKDTASRIRLRIPVTYFANPGDNITALVSALLPGDTLIFNNGTYASLTIADVHGTSDQPITIKAANDGQALLDASGTGKPLFIERSTYLTLQGFVAQNSNDSVVYLFANSIVGNVDHITLQRITAHGAAPGNFHVFNIAYGCTNILVEDCAGWGRGRYIFIAYHSSNVIFRRCFGYQPWQAQADFPDAPRSAFGVYGSHDVLLENVIGRHVVPFQADDNYYTDIWETTDDTVNFPTYNIQHYGCIFSDSAQGMAFTGTSGQGGTSQVFKDIYLSIPYSSIAAGFIATRYSARTIDWDGDEGGTIDNVTVVNSTDVWHRSTSRALPLKDSVFLGNGTVYSTTPPTTHTYNDYSGNTTIGVTLDGTEITTVPTYNTALYGEGAYLIHPSNLAGSGASGANIGCEILYQYVNGALTTTPLWPWPMEGRVATELGVSPTWQTNGSATGGPWKTLASIYGPATTDNMASRLRLLAIAGKDNTLRLKLLATVNRDTNSRLRLLAVKLIDTATRLRLQSSTLAIKDTITRLRLLALSRNDVKARLVLTVTGAQRKLDCPLRLCLYDNTLTFSVLTTRDGTATLVTRDGVGTLATRDGSSALVTRDGVGTLATRDGTETLITR